MGSVSRLRTVLAIAIAWIAGSVAWATDLRIEGYTERDGMPSTYARDVAVTPDGRVQFATRAGLVAFDGVEWRLSGLDGGLNPPARFRMRVDEGGEVWMLAASVVATLDRWDGERWHDEGSFETGSDCVVQSFDFLPGGSTRGVALATSCGLQLVEGGRQRRFTVADGLPSNVVREVRAFGGRLYVATAAGLAVLDGTRIHAVRFPGTDAKRPAFGLAEDTCDTGPCLWVVGDDWIGRIEPGGGVLVAESLETGPPDARRWAALADGREGLYFATNYHVFHYRPHGGLQELTVDDGLACGGGWGLARDHEGGVWVASLRGVSRITEVRLRTINAGDGLFADEVTAILERHNGEVLLGHDDGLSILDGSRIRTVGFGESTLGVPTRGRLLELVEDPDGTVWIAASTRGLGRFREDHVHWVWSRPDVSVTSVSIGADGALWFAAGSELFVDRGDGPRSVPFGRDVARGVRRLFPLADGSLWIATMGDGAYRLDRDGTAVHHGNALLESPNNVFAVHERPGGEVWFGTAAGLYRPTGTGGLEPVDVPRVERPVYFILRDSSGVTWFGTDDGVRRWDDERLAAISVEDGLGGRETNRSAAIEDSSGRVWIGTTGGATHWSPDDGLPSSAPPRVEILSTHRPARDGASELAFRFRAVAFDHRSALRYSTRLENLDDDWSPPFESLDGAIRYADLAPGLYRLHVRARGASGLWSEAATSEPVRVSLVWYRSRSILGLLMGGLLLGAFAVYRHVEQRRTSRRLAEEVERRVAELRSAHEELIRVRQLDSLGHLAGGIAHDFNNLLTVIMGNLSLLDASTVGRDREILEEAERALERARALTGQLLTFSRGGAPVRNPERIEEVLRESAEFVLRGSNVRAEFDFDAELGPVDIDAGQISQVLNNLLINAMQAMQALPDGGVVEIRAYRVERSVGSGEATTRPFVAVDITDHGHGIDPADLPHVFDPYFTTKSSGVGLGLSMAHSIVRRHDGRLTVASSARGTTFTILLPAGEVVPTPRLRVVAPPPRKEFRALVLDDDEGIRRVFEKMATALGFDVETCADGETAVSRYREAASGGAPFDVVVLDLTIPGGVGGEEAFRRLKRFDPRVRAVVTSGYANSSVLARHREIGFRAILHKPFGRDALADALDQALQGHVRTRSATP